MSKLSDIEQAQTWGEAASSLGQPDRGGHVSSPAFEIGSLISFRFQLRERIGAGGMGVVYRAYDQELEESVALKVLHSSFHRESSSLSDLRREVRSARRVASPHVARMHELHREPSFAYLVMEFIDVLSLASWMESGRKTSVAALRIALDVGRGLAAAHGSGVVHRDVKPANVLLRSDGTAVLTDFGLAHVLAAGNKAVTLGAAGTPGYMAPEQALGQRIGPTADVFALGVLVHQLLNGRLP